MEIDRLVRQRAVAQGGFILRSQALAIGLTDGQIRHRCESGDWKLVAGRGYQVIEMAGHLDRVRAALTFLPSAAASHETAAEIHSIPRFWRGQAIVSVHSRTTHEFPGVVVRRSHDLLPEHLRSMDGLAVTSVERTIVDMARFIRQDHLFAVVDELLAERRFDRQALLGIVDVVARRGRPGSTNLRELVAEYVNGPEIPASKLERRGRRLLLRAGLPVPEAEFAMPWSSTRRFDDAYPKSRIAIEWDSKRWHMSHDSFDTDRQRDNDAHVHGWKVLRFTWRDVSIRPDYITETISKALASTAG